MSYRKVEIPSLDDHLSYLLWVKRQEWTILEAIMIYLGLNPNFIPEILVRRIAENSDKSPKWWEMNALPKDITDFPTLIPDEGQGRESLQLLSLAKIDLCSSKIHNSMSPERWIRWLIQQNLSIDRDLWKATLSQYPDFPYEATMVTGDGRMDAFRLKKDEALNGKPHPDKNTYAISKNDLIQMLEAQKNLMISVSTGGPKIQSVNTEYVDRQNKIELALEKKKIKNPIPYSDLWAWYGKWSSGDLPTYQSRRKYLGDLFAPLITSVNNLEQGKGTRGAEIFDGPTGWARVDRSIGEIRKQLEEATTEEHFQIVGLLCRETIISLAQLVYDPSKHSPQDGIEPSKTDAKRMLDAYLSTELRGGENETARKHAKAALDLANDLTHRRTAIFRQAALCAEATASIMNIIAIISGQRDPM